jgi:hypothetical protein
MLVAVAAGVGLLDQLGREARAALVVVEMEQNHLLAEMVRPEQQIQAAVVAVQAAPAAPVSSFLRSISHENLSTHGH